MIFMSFHKGLKLRQYRVASVSLQGDLRQGEPAMDVVVPWNCNYSPISNKKKTKLVDVASWMSWTTWIWLSRPLYYYVVHVYFFFMTMLVWMQYKGLLVERLLNIFLQTPNSEAHYLDCLKLKKKGKNISLLSNSATRYFEDVTYGIRASYNTGPLRMG